MVRTEWGGRGRDFARDRDYSACRYAMLKNIHVGTESDQGKDDLLGDCREI
jgi:hypothetical protein